MQEFGNYGLTLLVGIGGGVLASRLKIPGGTIIGAMVAVICLKLITRSSVDLPEGFKLVINILIGVAVGSMFEPQILDNLKKLALPIVVSCLVLIGVGACIALVLVKTGLLDTATAYLGTSPGAMTSMIGLATDSKAVLPIVLTFHFVRVVVVILSAPLILHVMAWWLKP